MLQAAIQKSQIDNSLVLLQQLQTAGGGIALDVRIDKPGSSGECVQLNRLQAGDGDFRLYFHSKSSEGAWYNKPNWSCLYWDRPSDNWRDPIHAVSSLYTEQLPHGWPSNQVASGTTVFTYDGYLAYPKDLMPRSAEPVQSAAVVASPSGLYSRWALSHAWTKGLLD